MDQLEAMRSFVAVAQAGGFSAAARKLGVPVASLSRRIADFEGELGVRLFVRTTRSVVLSEAGAEFFSACTRIVDDVREAIESARGDATFPRGTLSVTAPLSFGVAHLQPVALEFLALYPEIDLRLVLVDRVVDLVTEQVDLAVRIASLPDSSATARALGAIRMLICASPAYVHARGCPEHPRQLLDHDCIAWSTLGPRDVWELRDGATTRAFPIRARLATNSAESAVAAACAGLGLVQATSYQLANALRAGQLTPVLRAFEEPATPVSLVYPRARQLPLRLRSFIDFLIPRLSRRLSDVQALVDAHAATP